MYSCSFNSQVSPEEALSYADKLHKVKILSERGRELLQTYVHEDRFQEAEEETAMDTEFYINRPLSKSGILKFLEITFFTEFYHRLIAINEIQNFQELQQIYQRRDLSEKILGDSWNDYRIWTSEFDEKEVEEEVIHKEYYPLSARWTVHPPLSTLKSNISTLGGMYRFGTFSFIHPTRSVMGHSKIRTIKDLFKLGLIHPSIYKDVITKVYDPQLIHEHDVLALIVEKTILLEDAFKE